MSEHPNAAIIRSGYEAMEKGDVAALAALLDDGITWHESTAGFEGEYHEPDTQICMSQALIGINPRSAPNGGSARVILQTCRH
jgi:hypothetical protein